MSTIVAMCPYCRAGGVRAPQSAVGASATCPKCKSSFTVMPSDGLPGWAKEPNSSTASSARTSALAPHPASGTETKPAAAMGSADITEPSPLLASDQAARATEPALPSEPEDPSETVDLGYVVGLAALTLVGVAVVASQFPYGRLVAVVLAIVGLLGGLAALGAEGRGRRAGAAAIGLHALILLVLLFLPSWLSLQSWRGTTDDDSAPKSPSAFVHQSGQSQALAPNAWIDAATASWQFDDLRVTVRSAYIGPAELIGPKEAKRKTKETYLHLRVRVVNSGVARDIPLSGWAIGQAAEGVRVTDSAGKALKLASFEEGWQPDRGQPSERLFPTKASELHLIFATPAGKVEGYRVQLAGQALGLRDEEIKFQIGAGFLARNSGP